MGKFEIIGGTRLQGEIVVDSSKNAVLPIIAGSILCDEPVVIRNIPLISDVKKMSQIQEKILDKATSLLKNKGINISYISEALGHSDIKTTENYLASFDRTEREKMATILTEL